MSNSGANTMQRAEQSARSMQRLDSLSRVTPNVTTNLQEFCDMALDTLRSYKPEIVRLDDRIENVKTELLKLDLGFRASQITRDEQHHDTSKRVVTLEERVAKLEVLVAVLPTWKSELMARIDTVGRESRVATEQLKLKTQLMEDNVVQQNQIVRERLDTLSGATRTLGEARQAHSERMDGLERRIQVNESSTNTRLHELDAVSKRNELEVSTTALRVMEQGVHITAQRTEIDALKDRTTTLEGDVGACRGDIIALQDKQELFHKSTVAIQKHLGAGDIAKDKLNERITKLENDHRVPELQAVAQDYQAFKEQVGGFMDHNHAQYRLVGEKLESMDARIEKGPPGLWKVTAQVAAQAEEIAAHKTTIDQSTRAISALEKALEEARQMLQNQRELAAQLDKENKLIESKMASELKRALAYTDAKTEHLAGKYEVEALRKLVEGVKKELEEGISSMGLRVKFDLLHDEMPQVATIKGYMEQTEQAMARAQERLAYVEEALHRETERGKALEGGWQATKTKLDQLLLEEGLDVGQLKREMQRMKSLFDELGRLAARGDILTVQSAEQLFAQKLESPAMAALMDRKILENKALRSELLNFVQRHEIEALRKILAENRQALIGLQVKGVAPAAAVPSSFGDPLVQLGPSLPAAAAPTYVPSPGGVPVPPISRGVTANDSLLMDIYTRMAAVEESAALQDEHGSALAARVGEVERGLRATANQVQSELPVVQQQLKRLAAEASGALAGPWVEDATRKLVNKTLLPRMVQRQAVDTQRLVRYIDEQVGRAAKGYEVEALRKSIASLRAQLSSSSSSSDGPASPGRQGRGSGGGAGADAGAGEASAAAILQPGGEPAVADVGEPHASHAHQAETPVADGQAGAEGGSLGMSKEEAAGVLSPEQQAGLLQVLLDRVESLESAASQASAALQGVGPSTSRTAGDAGPDGSSPSQKHLLALGAQVSDLQVAVHSLSTQMPAAAKAYEVEALKRSLADTQEVLAQALRQGPGQPLNLTITLPIMQTPDLAAVVAAVQAEAQAAGEEAQGAAVADPVAAEGGAEGVLADHQPAVPVVKDATQAASAAAAPAGDMVPSPVTPSQPQPQASESILAILNVLKTSFEGQKQQSGRMAARVSALEQTMTLTDERGRALEQQVSELQGSCQAAVSHLQETVPKLEDSMAAVEQRVESVRAALAAAGEDAQLVTTSSLEDLVAGSAALKEVVRQSVLSMGIPIDDGGGSFAGDLLSPLTSPSRLQSARTARRLSASAFSMKAPSAVIEENHEQQDALPVMSSPREGTEGAGPAGAGQQRAARPSLDTGEGARPISSTSAPQGGRALSRAMTARGVRSTRLALSARTPRYGSVGAHPASPAPGGGKPHGTPGFGEGETPRHLVGAEYADTELAGIMHDLMHITHAELKIQKEGPLPGVEDARGGVSHVREAALRRLKRKPFEAQKHVEMLEAAKMELDRLVAGAAVSTVDYLALYIVMLDIRLKLTEDAHETMKEQVSTAYRNLESVFDYLKRLQEAVNSKGSADALTHVDRMLRGLGKEMCAMGVGPSPGVEAGLLYNTKIGSIEFWAPYLLSGGGANRSPSPGAGGSPVRLSAGGAQRSGAGSAAGKRPATATPKLAPLPGVSPAATPPGSPAFTLSAAAYPPVNFYTEKRDIVGEQERVLSALSSAETQLLQGRVQNVSKMLVTSPGGSAPVVVRVRPSTARPSPSP